MQNVLRLYFLLILLMIYVYGIYVIGSKKQVLKFKVLTADGKMVLQQTTRTIERKVEMYTTFWPIPGPGVYLVQLQKQQKEEVYSE